MSDRVRQLLEQLRSVVDALGVELSGDSRAPLAQNHTAHTVAQQSKEMQSAHILAHRAQGGAQNHTAHGVARTVGRYVGRKEEKSSNLPTSEEVFERAKRAYRKRVGKTFGSLYRDIAGQWAGLVARHGSDVMVRAVELWAAELDRDYARSLRIPIAAFLKTSSEYIEQIEDGGSAAEATDSAAPVTEIEPTVGPGFRRPSRQV